MNIMRTMVIVMVLEFVLACLVFAWTGWDFSDPATWGLILGGWIAGMVFSDWVRRKSGKK